MRNINKEPISWKKIAFRAGTAVGLGAVGCAVEPALNNLNLVPPSYGDNARAVTTTVQLPDYRKNPLTIFLEAPVASAQGPEQQTKVDPAKAKLFLDSLPPGKSVETLEDAEKKDFVKLISQIGTIAQNNSVDYRGRFESHVRGREDAPKYGDCHNSGKASNLIDKIVNHKDGPVGLYEIFKNPKVYQQVAKLANGAKDITYAITGEMADGSIVWMFFNSGANSTNVGTIFTVKQGTNFKINNATQLTPDQQNRAFSEIKNRWNNGQDCDDNNGGDGGLKGTEPVLVGSGVLLAALMVAFFVKNGGSRSRQKALA